MLTSNSGRSCISPNQTIIAITNLFDGVDLYNLADQTLVGSVKIPIIENVPVPVIFGSRGHIATGGSSGVIHIHQILPPATIQKLALKGKPYFSLAAPRSQLVTQLDSSSKRW